ncbi:peptidylprolyl isomerase [Microbulbifer epialgicus]|uniref:peptidylprolyl isomerase n=1 Tax=Microbulbifer epialgicus TaxID=393907 RepID=A0ABV4P4J8_9GAMM
MSKDNAIQYIELPASPSSETPHQPQLPSACETGGCGGGQAPKSMPAFAPVRVNGVEIGAEDIAREMQHHPAESGEAAWHSAARALAIKELLLQEANTRYLNESQETNTVDRTETVEDATVRALLEQELPPTSITEAECQRYYEGHTHRFRTPDIFEAAHILLEPAEDSNSGWRVAEQRAKELANKVGDDAERFAAAAREFSGCPTAQQDGSLGQVRRGELDQAVQQALEALEEGSTARQPVRSRFGWHLVRLQRRISGQILPFKLAREKIFDMLEARAWVTSASKYIAELARAANIEGVQLDPLDASDKKAMENEKPAL